MDTKLLRQADYVLSKCGRPTPPAGASVVYVPKGFLLQAVVPVSSQSIITKEITGDTTWCLRAISSTVSSSLALYVQIQLPNGRFLINGLQDVTQFAGYGSYRYLFSKELPCPPGSKIRITLDTSIPGAGSSQPVVMLFEGAYAYYLRSNGERGAANVEEVASSMPRYLGTPNQNILAPCWMSGEGPRTPEGFEDDRFIYSSPVTTIALAGPSLTGTTQVQIQQTSDFECRRLLVDVTATTLVTAGSILMRARLSSGYQLMDDYIDVADYLGSTPWAKDWHCPKGDAVVFDFLLVDGAGTGSVSVQVHLDGVKRRKVAA
jgi:hypothetical protein